MIRFLFFIVSVFIHINLSAQVEFAPQGAEWCYTYYGGFGPNKGYVKMKYTADTTIQSKTIKIFELENINQLFDTINYIFLIHQKLDSVFMYSDFDQKFHYLFRNDVAAGETVFYFGGGEMLVEGVDTIDIGNSQLVRHKIKSVSGGVPGDWMAFDKAGPAPGFFDWWNAPIFDGYAYELKWYKDDLIEHYQVSEGACEDLFTGVDILNGIDEFTLFPNPVDNILYLKFPENNLNQRSYQIVDLSGRQVFYNNEITGNTIEVSYLAPGLYFLLVEINGVFYRNKFVKN